MTNKILKHQIGKSPNQGSEWRWLRCFYDDDLSIYRKDFFDDNQFQVWLEILAEYCKELDIISVRAIAEILKNRKVRSDRTAVIELAKLILVMPVTNSTSERLFNVLYQAYQNLLAINNETKQAQSLDDLKCI